MKKITVDVYEYQDLLLPENKEIKARVMEKNGTLNVSDSYWNESTIDDFKQIGKLIGLEVDKVYFSGFYSQGDGASFTGTYKYKKGGIEAIKAHAPNDKALHLIVQVIEDYQQVLEYKFATEIKQSGRYYHSNTMQFWPITDELSDELQSRIENREDDMNRLFRHLADWLYKNLQTDYEYLTSEEAILETIKTSDCTFYQNGTLA